MDIEKEVCAIIKKHFRCWCSSPPPYCTAVTEIVTSIQAHLEVQEVIEDLENLKKSLQSRCKEKQSGE